MNIKDEITKIINVLKDVVPPLETTIVKQKASHENIKSISKEMKKINYRLDRLRSDLKLAKEKEKIDAGNSSEINNECAKSGK